MCRAFDQVCLSIELVFYSISTSWVLYGILQLLAAGLVLSIVVVSFSYTFSFVSGVVIICGGSLLQDPYLLKRIYLCHEPRDSHGR